MSNRFFKGRFAQVAVLLAMAMYLVCCGLVIAAEPVPAAAKPAAPIAFVGLHGGVFDVLKAFGGPLGLTMDYVTDEQIRQETVDLARYQVVLLEMVRGDDKDHYRRLIAAAKQRRPDFRVVSISGVAERSLPELCKLPLDRERSAAGGLLRLRQGKRAADADLYQRHLPARRGKRAAAAGRRTPPHDLPSRLAASRA